MAALLMLTLRAIDADANLERRQTCCAVRAIIATAVAVALRADALATYGAVA